MAGIGSVVVQFLAENKMGKVLGDVKKGLAGVDDTSGKANKTFGKLSAAWAAAIPIAGAVVGVGVGLANALVDASKAALEDKNSSDKLAKTLENIPGITQKMIDANEDWISSMQLASLVSDTDLRDAVGKLTLATGDLTEAQQLTALAVDVSAASGKNLATVTDALSKAANGNTGALKRQFPWLDKNKDGTLTYAEAVDGLGAAYKGAAKEATKTKPWEVIQTIWGEIQESLGGILLPLFEEFGDWFSKKSTQDAIKKFIDKVGELASDLGDDLVNAIKDLIAWLKKPENQQKIKDWIHMLGEMAQTIGRVIGFIQTLITWLNKIPLSPIDAITKIGKAGKTGSTGTGGATVTGMAGRSAATTAPAPEPVVLVTEEQIYRAVSRIMMRGDARNGRLQRLA